MGDGLIPWIYYAVEASSPQEKFGKVLSSKSIMGI